MVLCCAVAPRWALACLVVDVAFSQRKRLQGTSGLGQSQADRLSTCAQSKGGREQRRVAAAARSLKAPSLRNLVKIQKSRTMCRTTLCV